MPPSKPKSKVSIPNLHARRPEPAWKGPCGEGKNGGVTQGLLSRYITCKERFRVQYVEGWRTAETFNPRTEFGSLWHCLEEGLAAKGWKDGQDIEPDRAVGCMFYAQQLGKKYPMDRTQIQHWYDVARALFPLYVQHWHDHPDESQRTPLLQEHAFDVPYKLPSGRTVRLRGKWDSVDIIRHVEDRTGGVWLQENKTKSSIHEGKLRQQLRFDLQTMLYLVALGTLQSDWLRVDQPWKNVSIKGVRYNVVRRSAHKSVESMLKKVGDDREAGRIGEWFARFEVAVSPEDMERFRRQFLDPCLENLCDDYEWWEACHKGKYGGDPFAHTERAKRFPDHCLRHYRQPFFYDPISEGAPTDLDEYLENGSTVGLRRAEVLFPELEDASR